jgi:hypothetical protein
MSDDIHVATSNITDPNGVHQAMEAHRAEACTKFGTEHAVYRGGSTTSVPTHDDVGNITGHIYVVTSSWAKPEPEKPIPTDGSYGLGGDVPGVAAEGKVGSLTTGAVNTEQTEG